MSIDPDRTKTPQPTSPAMAPTGAARGRVILPRRWQRWLLFIGVAGVGLFAVFLALRGAFG
tara:strand:+ start:19662 stop:19844 length:183 start_codon:yes stop_codon:yes gene_type:complete